MTALVGSGLLVALAAFLFMSAGAKAASPRGATSALIGLGLERRLAGVAVGVATSVEATAATAIVLWPDALLAQVLCVTLFGLFGMAGVFALLSGRKIECGCMGSLYRSALGWPQLAQFALVAFTIALMGRDPPGWDLSTAVAVLLALLVATGR